MEPDRAHRANRGRNMSSLIAEAVQQGDEFWRNDDWAMDEGEQDSDSSFESEEEKPDVFDSDFYDSDSDEEEEDEASESEDEAIAMIPRPKVHILYVHTFSPVLIHLLLRSISTRSR